MQSWSIFDLFFCNSLIYLDLTCNYQGPVLWRSIATNPGLNCNPSSFFFCSKVFFWIIFSSILFREFNHQIEHKKNKKLTWVFTLSYVNSNFALTLWTTTRDAFDCLNVLFIRIPSYKVSQTCQYYNFFKSL